MTTLSSPSWWWYFSSTPIESWPLSLMWAPWESRVGESQLGFQDGQLARPLLRVQLAIYSSSLWRRNGVILKLSSPKVFSKAEDKR